MYLYKEQIQELMKEFADITISEIEQKNEFLFALLEDTDWSMIIKSHALIESLVTDLLLSKTEEPKLRALIERLPLSDEQIGKIKVAKDYGLLSSSERTFIKKLSELRNNLVHKFENVDFNFLDYISTLDINQKKSWQKAFTWYEQEHNVKKSWVEATIINPKKAIWLSIYMFVSLTIVKISEIKGHTKINTESKKTMRQLLSDDV
jgi:hypothetical protein